MKCVLSATCQERPATSFRNLLSVAVIAWPDPAQSALACLVARQRNLQRVFEPESGIARTRNSNIAKEARARSEASQDTLPATIPLAPDMCHLRPKSKASQDFVLSCNSVIYVYIAGNATTSTRADCATVFAGFKTLECFASNDLISSVATGARRCCCNDGHIDVCRSSGLFATCIAYAKRRVREGHGLCKRCRSYSTSVRVTTDTRSTRCQRAARI